MSPERRRAFTMVELVVVTAIGAFIALIAGLALKNAARIFTNTSGRDAAMRHLLKARQVIENDLILARLSGAATAIQPAPATRGGGADGDAINFLSAVNVTSQRVETLADGSGNPYYFQNILYYPTTPTNHNALFSISCAGGNEDGGYDFQCPHKILLRRVEDQNPAFNPSDPSTQDVLLSPLLPFLTQPTNFPKTAAINTVAINLLTFRVQRQGGELLVDLRAVALADARANTNMGTVSYRNSPYTLEHRFSVFPKN